jgi:hypothetical protein
MGINISMKLFFYYFVDRKRPRVGPVPVDSSSILSMYVASRIALLYSTVLKNAGRMYVQYLFIHFLERKPTTPAHCVRHTIVTVRQPCVNVAYTD